MNHDLGSTAIFLSEQDSFAVTIKKGFQDKYAMFSKNSFVLPACISLFWLSIFLKFSLSVSFLINVLKC